MDKPNLLSKIKQLDTLSNDEKAYLVNLVNTKKKYGLVWEDKPEDVEEQLRTKLPVLKEVVEKKIEAPPQPSPEGREQEASPNPSKGGEPRKATQNPQKSLFEPENISEAVPKASPHGGGLVGASPSSSSLPLGEGRGGASGGASPNHILIEGDNLHALTALTFTHEGAIDVIYIDPPYNTGNKDFKYNDTFVDREDSYRHSKWLSFMHKRLKIAKRLLSDKGVIFISIDDNEQSPLKLLCDDIFGEINFIGTIVWFKKRKGSFLSNQLISLTEYVLPFCKNGPVNLFGGKPDNSESQPIVKRTNSRKNLNFKRNVVKTKLKNGIYKNGTYGQGSIASFLLTDIEVYNGLIINDFTINAPFVWSQEFLDAELGNGTEILINTLNLQVRVIRHNNSSIKAMPSFLDGREFGATNEDAYEFLKDMFQTDRPFAYSKPTNLVKKLIESSSYYNKSSVILDFFAGSGTTLHATMQLNAEDGGNRQCILVTNNENNIAEEVCYERNKRVIQGYTNSKGVEVPGLAGNNLRYYKTTLLGREPSLKNKRELTLLATELLCIKEDCYTEATAELGDFGWHKLFTNERGNFVYVVYNDFYVEEAVEGLKTFMAAQSPGIKMKVYVFANGQYAYAEEFEEIAENITLAALPDAIYKAYQNVLPKENKDFIPELEDERYDEPQTDAVK
jgi:adenine-specific DNA-methyltransferase